MDTAPQPASDGEHLDSRKRLAAANRAALMDERRQLQIDVAAAEARIAKRAAREGAPFHPAHIIKRLISQDRSRGPRKKKLVTRRHSWPAAMRELTWARQVRASGAVGA